MRRRTGAGGNLDHNANTTPPLDYLNFMSVYTLYVNACNTLHIVIPQVARVMPATGQHHGTLRVSAAPTAWPADKNTSRRDTHGLVNNFRLVYELMTYMKRGPWVASHRPTYHSNEN